MEGLDVISRLLEKIMSRVELTVRGLTIRYEDIVDQETGRAYVLQANFPFLEYSDETPAYSNHGHDATGKAKLRTPSVLVKVIKWNGLVVALSEEIIPGIATSSKASSPDNEVDKDGSGRSAAASSITPRPGDTGDAVSAGLADTMEGLDDLPPSTAANSNTATATATATATTANGTNAAAVDPVLLQGPLCILWGHPTQNDQIRINFRYREDARARDRPKAQIECFVHCMRAAVSPGQVEMLSHITAHIMAVPPRAPTAASASSTAGEGDSAVTQERAGTSVGTTGMATDGTRDLSTEDFNLIEELIGQQVTLVSGSSPGHASFSPPVLMSSLPDDEPDVFYEFPTRTDIQQALPVGSDDANVPAPLQSSLRVHVKQIDVIVRYTNADDDCADLIPDNIFYGQLQQTSGPRDPLVPPRMPLPSTDHLHLGIGHLGITLSEYANKSVADVSLGILFVDEYLGTGHELPPVGTAEAKQRMQEEKARLRRQQEEEARAAAAAGQGADGESGDRDDGSSPAPTPVLGDQDSSLSSSQAGSSSQYHDTEEHYSMASEGDSFYPVLDDSPRVASPHSPRESTPVPNPASPQPTPAGQQGGKGEGTRSRADDAYRFVKCSILTFVTEGEADVFVKESQINETFERVAQAIAASHPSVPMATPRFWRPRDPHVAIKHSRTIAASTVVLDVKVATQALYAQMDLRLASRLGWVHKATAPLSQPCTRSSSSSSAGGNERSGADGSISTGGDCSSGRAASSATNTAAPTGPGDDIAMGSSSRTYNAIENMPSRDSLRKSQQPSLHDLDKVLGEGKHSGATGGASGAGGGGSSGSGGNGGTGNGDITLTITTIAVRVPEMEILIPFPLKNGQVNPEDIAESARVRFGTAHPIKHQRVSITAANLVVGTDIRSDNPQVTWKTTAGAIEAYIYEGLQPHRRLLQVTPHKSSAEAVDLSVPDVDQANPSPSSAGPPGHTPEIDSLVPSLDIVFNPVAPVTNPDLAAFDPTTVPMTAQDSTAGVGGHTSREETATQFSHANRVLDEADTIKFRSHAFETASTAMYISFPYTVLSLTKHDYEQIYELMNMLVDLMAEVTKAPPDGQGSSPDGSDGRRVRMADGTDAASSLHLSDYAGEGSLADTLATGDGTAFSAVPGVEAALSAMGLSSRLSAGVNDAATLAETATVAGTVDYDAALYTTMHRDRLGGLFGEPEEDKDSYQQSTFAVSLELAQTVWEFDEDDVSVEMVKGKPTTAPEGGPDVRRYRFEIEHFHLFQLVEYLQKPWNALSLYVESFRLLEATTYDREGANKANEFVTILSRSCPYSDEPASSKGAVALSLIMKDDVDEGIRDISTTASLRGLTLDHISGDSWLFKVIDFVVPLIDMTDYYEAQDTLVPQLLTKLFIHFEDCCIWYKPPALYAEAILGISTLYVHSHIVEKSTTSGFKLSGYNWDLFLLDDARSLSAISVPEMPGDLATHVGNLGFVPVANVDSFEVFVRTTSESNIAVHPDLEVDITDRRLTLTTCADSFDTLVTTLSYWWGCGVPIILEMDAGDAAKNQDAVVVTSATGSGGIFDQIDHNAFGGGAGTQVGQGKPDSPLLVSTSSGQVRRKSSSSEAVLGFVIEDYYKAADGSGGKKWKRHNHAGHHHHHHHHHQGPAMEFAVYHPEGAPDRELRLPVLPSLAETLQSESVEDQGTASADESTAPAGTSAAAGPNSMPGRGYAGDDDIGTEGAAWLGDGPAIINNYFSLPTVQDGDPSMDPPSSSPFSVSVIRVRDANIRWRLFGGSDWARVLPETLASPLMASQRGESTDDVTGEEGTAAALDDGPDVHNDTMDSALSHVADMSHDGPGEATDDGVSEAATRTARSDTILSGMQTDYVDPSPEPGPPKAKPHRLTDQVIEMDFNGLNLQFNEFPAKQNQAWRMTAKVKEVEITDYIRTSSWRKFLYPMRDANRPRREGSHAVELELESIHPDPKHVAEEFRMKLSALPLMLNVDQDAVEFLAAFFSYVTPDVLVGPRGMPLSVSEEVAFFQVIEVAPLHVCINYKPKRIDFGALWDGDYSQLVNMLPLENMELDLVRVRRLAVHGWASIAEELGLAYQPHIIQTQVHKYVTGLQPVRPLVNVYGGIADLVMLPVEQYRKDGRVLRGLQRGTRSFLKHLSMETVNVGVTAAIGAQSALEFADQVISGEGDGGSGGGNAAAGAGAAVGTSGGPGEAGDHSGPAISKMANQPMNASEGLSQAGAALQRGVTDGVAQLIALPVEGFERHGMAGAVGSVFRAVPIAILRPVIGTTEAVSKTLLGIRNSVDPGKRQDDQQKYKSSPQ
eukprot:TRINITY_DN1008_c0_g1_i8.p1 TRINITY_DN1008_c0_g1~~TRINITY_DN1008_c0_g1_i8.p1  ORF type:complete len:2307 (+),score=578.38 TRINITY_DN1008_c0_g1_i8:369-7289(+)